MQAHHTCDNIQNKLPWLSNKKGTGMEQSRVKDVMQFQEASSEIAVNPTNLYRGNNAT